MRNQDMLRRWLAHARSDSPRTLALLMATIAVLFVVGIVTAFNHATRHSPADLIAAQQRTSASGVHEPVPPRPRNTWT